MPSTNTKASPGLGHVFGLVAILTFLSKFAGLARDIVVLQAFGTSMVADAYNYAYLLTGNVLILFGGLGGPFHSSTVAILAAKKDTPELGRLVFQLFLYTALVLSAVCALAWIMAPSLIPIIAPATGHNPAYQTAFWHETTVQFKIMIPLIVISGVIGILYGISNIYNRVFWPSLSPAIASLAIIVAIVAFPEGGGLCLAAGTLAGAIGQLMAQLPSTFSCNLKWDPALKPEPGLRQFAQMLGPAAISTGIGQLTVYVDAFFTSQLQEGSWTAVMNSNRLVQLPLGVLLTAMLVPILPRFTEQVAANRIDDLKQEFRRALRILWFLALPVAALLIAIPGPIIQLLFERGHFDSASRELVTTALVFLVPSIFFYVGRDLITRAFYAHHDSTRPFLVALLAIFVKALLDWLLVGPLGIGGISLSTTLVTIFNLVLLSWLLRRKIGRLGTSTLIRPAAIMLFASAIGGVLAYHTQIWLHHLMPGAQLWALALSVSGAAASGLGAYACLCLVFKLEEPTLLIKRFLPARRVT